MVFVGIDVAKDKHDLFAVDSGGVVYNMVAPCIVYIFYHLVAVCVYRGIIAQRSEITPQGKIKCYSL